MAEQEQIPSKDLTFKELVKQDITKIYLITNCFEDPNKVYIGKTKNCRKLSHQKTYGKNITYDYIDEINSLDRKDWTPLESFWIEYFRQMGFEIQNSNKNGGGGNEFLSELTKDKISKSNIGKNIKKIIQYSLDGKILKKWDSIIEASRSLNIKTNSMLRCGKEYKTAGGFIWRKENEPLDLSLIPKHKSNKGVSQFDLEGNFIRDFDSITEASKYCNIHINNIQYCCSGKINFTNKFRFLYTKNKTTNKLPPLPKRNFGIIYEVDYNGIIKNYTHKNDIINDGLSDWIIRQCLTSKNGCYKQYKIKKFTRYE